MLNYTYRLTAFLYENITTYYSQFYNDSVIEKMKNRINELEEIGHEEKLNIKNMEESKNMLLLFLEKVIFLDYYSFVLDDDGYYTLRMKNKDSLLLLTFDNYNIHFYINSKKNNNSGNTNLEKLFYDIDSSIYEDFFIQKKVNMDVKDDTNLVRFCKNKTRMTDDKINEFSEIAFRLRKNEKCLSFDLAEHHNKASLKENIAASIQVLSNKLDLNFKKGMIAVLYTKDIRDKCGPKITKIEQDSVKDSHVGIYYDKADEDDVSFILTKLANDRKDEIDSLI